MPLRRIQQQRTSDAEEARDAIWSVLRPDHGASSPTITSSSAHSCNDDVERDVEMWMSRIEALSNRAAAAVVNVFISLEDEELRVMLMNPMVSTLPANAAMRRALILAILRARYCQRRRDNDGAAAHHSDGDDDDTAPTAASPEVVLALKVLISIATAQDARTSSAIGTSFVSNGLRAVLESFHVLNTSPRWRGIPPSVRPWTNG